MAKKNAPLPVKQPLAGSAIEDDTSSDEAMDSSSDDLADATDEPTKPVSKVSVAPLSKNLTTSHNQVLTMVLCSSERMSALHGLNFVCLVYSRNLHVIFV